MPQMRVFVSHSHEDEAFCHALVEGLRRAGADVWYDEHNLGPGELTREIQRELGRRPVFLVVLSKTAFASRWVKRETLWAYELADRDPTRILLPITAGPIERNDFSAENEWLFLNDFKRVEAAGFQPYPEAEAVARTLRMLQLTQPGEAAPPTEPTASEGAAELVARGRALNAQQRFGEALSFFQRAADLEPRSFDIWFNTGVSLSNMGMHAGALPVWDLATTLNPANAPAWSGMGVALDGVGRHEDALVAYERALALEPAYAEAWRNKGSALSDLNRYIEALDAYDHAVTLNNEDAAAWTGRSGALFGLKHFKTALTSAVKATTLDPSNALAWLRRGNALWGAKRYDEVDAIYDQALALDPTMYEAWHNKAVTLRLLGRTAEADEAERRMRALNA